MVTVLHYAPGFRNGGIESRLLDWYRNIDRSLIRFVLVKLNTEDDTDNIREFIELGGTFYNLPPFSLHSALSFSQRIREILAQEKVDIVHVHDVNSGVFVLREAKKNGIKCRILHSRTTSNLPHEKHVFIKSFFRKVAPIYANFYFACSVEAGIWGIGKRYQKVTSVIKNGIQVERFRFDENRRDSIRLQLGVANKIVIGTVGRLSDQKNIPFLVEVFNRLIKENKDYRLVIVGDGDRTILQRCFQKNSISQYVIVVGEKKNVWDYYMSFDIFCGTSLYEGFGTTAIESQASGLPTLVSEGFPESVAITDFIWRLPLDNQEKWVDTIKNNIGKRFAQNGLDMVNSSGYNAYNVAKELEAFYLTNARGGNN